MAGFKRHLDTYVTGYAHEGFLKITKADRDKLIANKHQ